MLLTRTAYDDVVYGADRNEYLFFMDGGGKMFLSFFYLFSPKMGSSVGNLGWDPDQAEDVWSPTVYKDPEGEKE